MEYKNFWGTSMSSLDDLKYTEDIYAIMKEQCEYLYKDTQGKVFAVFGEIKLDGSLLTMARTIANVFRSVSGLTGMQETVSEVSTKELIDANGMYSDKNYAFEICTEKYRFRLFELRMTPIYPIEMNVDEDICKNIGYELNRIAIPMEENNCFKIVDEEVFCDVLQKILQDRKVRYIISELQRRVSEEMKKEEVLPDKVIVCEGRTDEVVLHAIAQKLECAITIVVAEGKYNVPVVFDKVNVRNTKSRILIVVDSDGDEENTKKMIVENLGEEGYELAIINNCIEDWFSTNMKGFSKLKLMQTIGAIIEEIDFEELSKKHDSFARVVEFMNK